MLYRNLLSLIIFLFLSINFLYATGVSAFSAMLDNTIAARALVMGNSYTAVCDDGNCLWFNPGGLGNMAAGRGLLVSYSRGLVDDNYGTLVYVDKFREHNFGLGVITLDAGVIEINNSDGSSRTVRAEQDYGLVIGYARKIKDYLSVGGAIKLLSSRLVEEASAQAYALDVGCYYRGSDKSSFGLSVQNFGTDVTYHGGIATGEAKDQLPLTVRLGGSTELMNRPKHRLTGSLDLIKSLKEDVNLHLGFEYWYKNFFALRVGYRAEYDYPYTGGFGVKLSQYQIDYGVAFLNTLGTTHYVSVAIRL